jgi:hypothetical protein
VQVNWKRWACQYADFDLAAFHEGEHNSVLTATHEAFRAVDRVKYPIALGKRVSAGIDPLANGLRRSFGMPPSHIIDDLGEVCGPFRATKVGCILFGHNHILRERCGQALTDKRLRSKIGNRHRAFVAFLQERTWTMCSRIAAQSLAARVTASNATCRSRAKFIYGAIHK